MGSRTGHSPWRPTFHQAGHGQVLQLYHLKPFTQFFQTFISDRSLGGPQTQICTPPPTPIVLPQTLTDSNGLHVHSLLSACLPPHELPSCCVLAARGLGRLSCRAHSAFLSQYSTQWGFRQQLPVSQALSGAARAIFPRQLALGCRQQHPRQHPVPLPAEPLAKSQPCLANGAFKDGEPLLTPFSCHPHTNSTAGHSQPEPPTCDCHHPDLSLPHILCWGPRVNS